MRKTLLGEGISRKSMRNLVSKTTLRSPCCLNQSTLRRQLIFWRERWLFTILLKLIKDLLLLQQCKVWFLIKRFESLVLLRCSWSFYPILIFRGTFLIFISKKFKLLRLHNTIDSWFSFLAISESLHEMLYVSVCSGSSQCFLRESLQDLGSFGS